MSRKTIIWFGIVIGSLAGSFIPTLWGADPIFSMSSIVFSTAGSILGIWVAYKLTE